LLVSRESSASADRRHRTARRRDKLPALCAVAPCNLRLEGSAARNARRVGTAAPLLLVTIGTPQSANV